jgi:toxin-antitoxin system PIN domain toxin
MMKGYLLDINVLLALTWPHHVHHQTAHAWFEKKNSFGWATCLVTHLGFVRLSSHPSFSSQARPPHEAFDMLRKFCALKHHHFWSEPPLGLLHQTRHPVYDKVLTHNHVTDAYLVNLAAYHHGRVATFDQTMEKIFPKLVERVREECD